MARVAPGPLAEPFSLAMDEGAARLTVTVRGFWSAPQVAAFLGALGPAARAFRERHARYAVLVDATDFPVQSAEVGQAFHALLEAGAARTRGRTAVLVTGSLNRFQATRVLAGPNIGVFLDREEADAWLAGA